jgi:hypothetical protein
MARIIGRDTDDLRVAHLEHKGARLTVRLVDPQVSIDGRDLRPDSPVIAEGVEHHPDREMTVRGWLAPSRFAVEGLEHLRVTFSLAPSSPFGGRPLLAVTDLVVEHASPFRRPWSLAEIPPVEVLLGAAGMIASVWVIRKPGPFPGGATSHTFRISHDDTPAMRRKVRREFERAQGEFRVVGLVEAFTASDLEGITTKGRRDLPKWDSTVALREVARIYAEAYRDGARPLKPIEEYIADRNHRAPGTVRRQITEARKRGFIPNPAAPRRAVKSSRKSPTTRARKGKS